jgi:serine/threonine protein kinase
MTDAVLMKPGEVVNGKYRVVRLVDDGGIGAVYECRRIKGDARVAIKVMRGELSTDKTWIAKFDREARAAARIVSPRIARVLEVGGLSHHRKFVVMEFLDGEKLSARLERETRLPPRTMVDLGAQTLEALEAVHDAGFIHRSISPENVFLQRMGRSDYVCLMDFGVAKEVTDQLRASTRIGQILHAAAFTAPEAIERGQKAADVRSDLFSVGAVVYRGVSGTFPYPADDAFELVERARLGSPRPVGRTIRGVDAVLDGILRKSLAYDPNARYQTAREMQEAFVQWLARIAEAEQPPPARQAGRPQIRKERNTGRQSAAQSRAHAPQSRAHAPSTERGLGPSNNNDNNSNVTAGGTVRMRHADVQRRLAEEDRSITSRRAPVIPEDNEDTDTIEIEIQPDDMIDVVEDHDEEMTNEITLERAPSGTVRMPKNALEEQAGGVDKATIRMSVGPKSPRRK